MTATSAITSNKARAWVAPALSPPIEEMGKKSRRLYFTAWLHVLKLIPCADKARLTGELTRLQTQSRRSKQERDQLDNLLAASTHKQAQQEYQIQTLQVLLFKILISLLM